MKTIQMIVTQEGDALFLCGFNKETNEISFRSSFNPRYLQTEKITSDKQMVYTNSHFFPIGFLNKFIKESNLNNLSNENTKV